MGMFDPDHVCITCGHIGSPITIWQGTALGEFSLWIVFIFLGLIAGLWLLLFIPLLYSIYRALSSKNGCSLCKGTQIIPADSPNGQAIIASKKNTTTE